MGARQSNLENNDSSTENNGEDVPCSSKDSTRTENVPNGSPKRSFKFDNRPLTSTAFKFSDSDKLSTFVDESDIDNGIRAGSKRKRNSPNGDVDFYQAYNNTSSIISAPAASPQFTSSHLNAYVKKFSSKNHATSDEADSTKIDIPPDHPTKRLRLEVEDDDATFLKSNVGDKSPKKATADVSIRFFDRLQNLDSALMNSSRFSSASGIFKPKPAAQVSLFSLHQKHKAAPSTTPYSRPTSSLSVISSDTRRLLRDLERRTCSPAAIKHIKTEQRSDASSPQPSQLLETTLPPCNGIDSQKPPVSSLITPYRANVLPRLATLNRTPYPKIAKETADKGVSADLIGSCFVDESKLSNPYETKTTTAPKLTSTKSSLKLKTVGGARNKFSAHGLEDDEPEILYDNQLPTLPRLPLPAVPASGFLTSGSTIGLTPSSPPADSFKFSAPILLARPSDINSSKSMKSQISPKKSNGDIKKSVHNKTDDDKSKSKNVKLFSEKPAEFVRKAENATEQWSCSTCFIKNPVDKEKCMTCNAQKPVPLKTDSVIDKWTCEVCFIKNADDQQTCLACKGSKPGEKKSSPFAASNDLAAKSATVTQSWSCAECYIKVPGDKTNCIACGSPKPGLLLLPKNAKQEDKKEENMKPWNCTTCFVKNPADKVKCLACTAPKPGCTFAPISFGFKPTPPPKPPVETSSFGVQCTPPPESESAPAPPKTSSFVPSFGITKQEKAQSEESSAALSETLPKTTAPFTFGFTSSSATTTAPASSLSQPTVSTVASAFGIPSFATPAASSAASSTPSFGFSAPVKTTTAIGGSIFDAKPADAVKEKTDTAPESKAPIFSFGASKPVDSSQNKAEAGPVAKTSLFSFGGTAPTATTTTAPASTSSSSSLSFNFSSASSVAPAFGTTTTSSNSSGGFTFNLPTSSTSTVPLFGNSEPALKKSAPLTFGFNTTASPASSEQPAASTASSLFAIPAATTTTTSKTTSFGFNAPLKTSTAADSLFAPTSTAAPTSNLPLSFNFSAATSAAPAPTPVFGASTTSNKTAGGFAFNLPTSSTTNAPLFGAPSVVTTNATSNSSGGFSFGLPNSNSTPNFQFSGASSTTNVNFGATSPPTLLFGSSANTGLEQPTQPAAAGNLFSLTAGSRPPPRKTLTARRTRALR